ncbi:hypothetical protein GEMRC1_006410 [Eukaryota sp. GEM-RC1]
MKTNTDLLRELMTRQSDLSQSVIDAMSKIDRKHFVPPKLSFSAYDDSPLSIGLNQTISAPHMHAMMATDLEEKLFPGSNVLDIGAGSGYLTALMAEMVGPTGHVTAIERIPELTAMAQHNLSHYPHLSKKNHVSYWRWQAGVQGERSL